MNIQNFSDFGLAEPILRAVAACGYTTPTPIQAKAIPGQIEGRDILGIAQTGTGKTAAFVLPILQRLMTSRSDGGSRAPRALILAPTRELAIQIGDDLRAYSKFLHLRHAVIFGGVKEGAQISALARGVDILVATPGRLLDLVQRRKADLRSVECFVLDEADRMLDMGFIRDVRKLVDELPRQRQSLLFSATMPAEIAKLADGLLSAPLRVEVSPQSTPIDRIDQRVHHVMGKGKPAMLADLLAGDDLEKVIVFTRTKHRANRVSDQLAKLGIESEAIHGNKSQAARQRALKGFRSGAVRVLVATDIAARGIDVDGISHVINYELPNEPESYVHRIGRTARAGASGTAISFCDADEQAYLRDIERLTGIELTVVGERPKMTGQKPARPTGRGPGKRSAPEKAPGAAPRRRPRRRRRAA